MDDEIQEQEQMLNYKEMILKELIENEPSRENESEWEQWHDAMFEYFLMLGGEYYGERIDDLCKRVIELEEQIAKLEKHHHIGGKIVSEI